MSSASAAAKEQAFVRRLLAWFRRHRRALPWRDDRDPYRIWVSEVMLQQTRVSTAVPYFQRFVRRFPDLSALAAADLGEVLKAWEGLGYYGRARRLKRAADLLVADGVGSLPADYERLLALPGVGHYTAGAIMSLAWNRPHPVLDANVRRVLGRVWAIAGPPDSARVRARLWRQATRLIPPGGARRFNEALMELGELVCTPKAARCERCPVAALCTARRTGRIAELPGRRRRAALPHYDVVAAVIQRGRRVLIAQRRAEAMLGGLWEFPGGKVEAGESLEECLHRELAEELGIVVRLERAYLRVPHAYSHFRITLHALLCRHRRGRPRPLGCAACRWVALDELAAYAFPKADRVVLAALVRERGGGAAGARPAGGGRADVRRGAARAARRR